MYVYFETTHMQFWSIRKLKNVRKPTQHFQFDADIAITRFVADSLASESEA